MCLPPPPPPPTPEAPKWLGAQSQQLILVCEADNIHMTDFTNDIKVNTGNFTP